jgi:acetyl-CoA C-acetyltransferase
MRNAVIVSYARTSIGKFRGGLSHLTAPQLGAAAIRGALSRLGDTPNIAEAYMGNVLSAGVGQAPCRQAVLGAGLPESTICNTINKVCASGMKSIMLAAQTIESNNSRNSSNHPVAMLAGGMESMSNTPHYLPTSRTGTALGHAKLVDGIIHDGLWDPYDDVHMGTCAEQCAIKYNISREDQDAYAIESYNRARKAMEEGFFAEDVVAVDGPRKRASEPTESISNDEEPNSANLDKLPSLRAAFEKEGTVTAGNSSSINDGAAALILMDEDQAIAMGLTPLARIRGYADAEGPPVEFTTAPSNAAPIAVDRAGMMLEDVEYHEINEAFSVVVLANMMLLDLDPSKVNVFGGAVSLGHPIGMSGARIVGSLYQVLKKNDATIGCASICNGGGGASAVVLERLN